MLFLRSTSSLFFFCTPSIKANGSAKTLGERRRRGRKIRKCSGCSATVFLLFATAMLLPRITDQLHLDSCASTLGVELLRTSEEGGPSSGGLTGGPPPPPPEGPHFLLPDSAFKASSSYDSASVGPQNGRLHFDSSNGGAWCPSRTLSKASQGSEYLEVDLGQLSVITHTLTQGRFGSGRGQEYAEAYTVQYWRPGMAEFREYRDVMGRTVLPGNDNTYAVANNTLDPAIIARKIRLLPYSEHPRTVCMRLGLIGCSFNEGVVSYSIPQGMVRGAMLELMDHTFDGHEDSQTGDLRGGLGQLVDGRFGDGNFKATGLGGAVRGYDWVGWKKRPSGAVNLIFTFDMIRTFSRVDIHANNHFSKDIQVFRQAKIYFSNEEDKFGDDRCVDFKYMPDLALENARNVSVNLKGEHGKYVMLQLYFAAKWILISEVTFVSEPYQEKLLFPEDPINVPEENHRPRQHSFDLRRSDDDETAIRVANFPKGVPPASTAAEVDIRTPIDHGQVPGGIDSEPRDVGVVVGVLLTIILVLLGGIGYAVHRSRNGNKRTPTHSSLPAPFKFGGYAPYSNKHGSGGGFYSSCPPTTTTLTQETIYEEPLVDHRNQLYSSIGFLSLNHKYNSCDQPSAMSATMDRDYDEDDDDEDDDYAEPLPLAAVLSGKRQQSPPLLKPLPLIHYARPMTPPQESRRASAIAQVSLLMSPTASSANTVRSSTNRRRLTADSRSGSGSSSSTAMIGSYSKGGVCHYASADVCIPDSVDLARLYEQIDQGSVDMLLCKPSRSVSIETVTVKLNEIDRQKLELVEKLGEGQFGEIHLCRILLGEEEIEPRLVAVKSLKRECSEDARSDFEHEARVLTSLNDPNLVSVLGVCFETDPLCMICEFSEYGDLYQFLQDHVADTSLSKSPGVPTLSYGSLIYMAAQVASGMKYLENLNFVHRDLATRNCLVCKSKVIKISDFGMSRSCYRNDYFKSQSGCLLPIRWMAWESVLMGKFTTKSDVWSFGVTLWEILTLAREQPFESMTDEKVISNLSGLYRSGRPAAILPNPHGCPREVRDLMKECWQREDKERPSFREIHLFLCRKNLGYDPNEGDDA